MKKLLLILSILLLSLPIFAQQSTDSATLTIRGNVPVIVSVTIQEGTNAQSLDMSSPGTYTFEVGTLTFRSNTDFNLTVDSTNGTGTDFLMANADGDTITYTLSTTDGTTYQNGGTVLSQGRTTGNTTLTFEVTYTISDPLPNPGDYEDIITFNIAGQ